MEGVTAADVNDGANGGTTTTTGTGTGDGTFTPSF